MFNNELMADVHFIVGPLGGSQKVPAHKVKTFYCFNCFNFFLKKRATFMFVQFKCLLDVRLCSSATENNYSCSFIELSKRRVILFACVSDASVCSSPPSQYVLAVGSSVFCAMFYGDLAEEESEIHIPDVEPAAFLILLK